jgi:hypothetical protein
MYYSAPRTKLFDYSSIFICNSNPIYEIFYFVELELLVVFMLSSNFNLVILDFFYHMAKETLLILVQVGFKKKHGLTDP